jgi:hypothetical protein
MPNIPKNEPLTADQKKQVEPSGILPSGEANFFDFLQFGSGYIYSSGTPEMLLYTYPEFSGEVRTSGNIFNYDILTGAFSSASSGFYVYNLDGTISGIKIQSFELFNPYIHYYPKNPSDLSSITVDNMHEDRALKIPFISSYKISDKFDPYPKRSLNKKEKSGGFFDE